MKFGDIGTHQPLLPHNIYSPTGEVKTEPKNSLGEYASAPTKGRWYAAETENALPDTSSSQNDGDIGYLLLDRGMRCSLSGCGTERDFIVSGISELLRDLLSHGYDFHLSAGWSLMEPM